MLSQRLRDLEAAGILERRKLAPPAASQVYGPTERGRELEPVLIALGRWGSTAPLPPEGLEIGVDSTTLGLRTLFDPSAADGLEATVELRLNEHTFSAQVANGSFEVVRGPAQDPDAVLAATPGTLAALLWQGQTLAGAARSDDAEVEGDRRRLERFLRLFPLPQ